MTIPISVLAAFLLPTFLQNVQQSEQILTDVFPFSPSRFRTIPIPLLFRLSTLSWKRKRSKTKMNFPTPIRRPSSAYSAKGSSSPLLNLGGTTTFRHCTRQILHSLISFRSKLETNFRSCFFCSSHFRFHCGIGFGNFRRTSLRNQQWPLHSCERRNCSVPAPNRRPKRKRKRKQKRPNRNTSTAPQLGGKRSINPKSPLAPPRNARPHTLPLLPLLRLHPFL